MKNKTTKFNSIFLLLLWCFLIFGFTDTIDTSVPAGSDDPAEADDNMRRIQGGFQELGNVEHDYALTGTAITGDGTHTDITTTSITNAGTLANTGDFAVNTDKFTVAAASGNTLVGGTLDIQGTTAVVGVLDEDAMGSDSATNLATQQSIKKYVDDQNVVQNAGLIKAWVNFDGDDGSVRDSFNVTGVNRSATGTYTITWDTNFGGTDYVIAGFCGDATKGAGFVCGISSDAPLQTTTAVIHTRNTGNQDTDYNVVTVIAIGAQ